MEEEGEGEEIEVQSEWERREGERRPTYYRTQRGIAHAREERERERDENKRRVATWCKQNTPFPLPSFQSNFSAVRAVTTAAANADKGDDERSAESSRRAVFTGIQNMTVTFRLYPLFPLSLLISLLASPAEFTNLLLVYLSTFPPSLDLFVDPSSPRPVSPSLSSPGQKRDDGDRF